MTLDRMLEGASKNNPDKPALVSINERLTYSELNDRVSSLANSLLNLGLQRSDRVAMLVPKSMEAVIAFLGVIRAGGIIAPINMRLKADTLRVNFNQIDPFAVIADPLYLPLLHKFYDPGNPQNRIILTGSSRPLNTHSFHQFCTQESNRAPGIELKEDDVSYLNYTSGTTGVPKGASTTHGNLMWNTKGAVEMFKLTADDVHLCMFSVYAHPHEIFSRSIYLGGTSVILDSMYPKTIARAIQDFGVTCLMAVPPFYRSLFPTAREKRFNLSSLRIAEAGGVFSSAEFCQEFEDIFERRFLPVWGSTETTGIALATPPEGDYRIGTLGKACPGYEVRVMGSGGRDADVDETGELVITGPGVVEGYYNLPEDTEKTFHHGHCHTGDMVRRDEDGFFHFLGRRSGLMKVAGLKVYPLEVETVLLKHPGVEEAVVISLPDSLRGEIPKAFIVPRGEAEIDKGEIRAFCREHLADYKVPHQIEIRSELPRTESGKVSYAELTQSALDDLAEDELKSLQRRIKSIDSKILEMLNARVELVKRIINLRGRLDQSLYSALHGDEVIRRIIEENKGPIYDEAVEEIFKKILTLDLMIQA